MKLSPALAYLAANPWAMEFALFGRLTEVLEAHAAGVRADADTVAAIKAAAGDAEPAEPVMEWSGKTAIIPVRGALARYASSVNGFCQPEGRSAEAVQRDLLTAAERGASKIVLRIDSPGGEVAGTAETAALVRSISAGGIPVVAFVDGLAASAAYWIASQADEIVASSPTAKVGSIGIATAVRMAGPEGRNVVITSAPGKAGAATNDAHIANARAIVVDLATAFADAVAAGRGLTAEQAAAIATGEVWTAQRALGLGLIDRVATWSQFMGNANPDQADPAAEQRRKAIADRMAATVTVSAPAPRSTAQAQDQITQAPAQVAATSPETSMDLKLKAKLAALCQQHPTHAAALVAEATKDGATEAALDAHLAHLTQQAERAALVADRDGHKARADKAEAEVATEKARADAEKARADKAEADLAKLKAHAASEDVGADGAKPKAKTADEIEAMSPTERAKFFAAGGQLAKAG